MPILLRNSTTAALRVALPLSKPNNLQSTATATRKALQPLSVQKTSSESSTPTLQQQQQHLVLVGGGHAHAQVIRALNWASRPDNLKVTLIDPQSSASYSGMVPGCISNLYKPEDTLLHLQPLADWAGIEFMNDKVIDIDLENKVVHLASNDNNNKLSFDCISVDIGSTSRSLDDTPGARQFTIPTRPISKLVERIDRSMEDLDDTAEPHCVVIGGGAAGVELSMSLNGRFKSQFPYSRITLLDTGTELLPGESVRGRDALKQIMNEQGIQVVHRCQVDELSDERIFAMINGESTTIPYTHCIWATGAGAHPLARRLQTKGLDVTVHGWIKVNEYLQSLSHPFLFAAGDCSHIENLKNGSPPKAGVYAVRAGPVLIENLTRYLQQEQQKTDPGNLKLKEYVPQSDFLKLLVCGDGRALGLRFGHAFHGKWVMQLKDEIDSNFMDLFKRENLPELHPEDDAYDTSQYDAKMAAKATLTAEQAAALLSRTDDDVDYQEAWRVIRTMAEDETFQGNVLSNLEQRQVTRMAKPMIELQ